MRDLVILAGLAILIPMILRRPFVGALAWTWLALASPHQEAFGFSAALRPNLLIVFFTLISIVISSEAKRWPGGTTALLFALFMLWTTITTVLAADPASSFKFYNDFVVKMALHILVLMIVVNTPHRLQALMWVFGLALGYHAVKIGLVTLYSGFVIGSYTGFGPVNTMIEDRNHFAIAMLMLAPILFFLRKHAEHTLVKHAALAGMIMCFLAVIGSFSRGGLVSMVAVIGYLWLKTKNKLISGTIMAVAAGAIMMLAPAEYRDRITTVASQFDQAETNFGDDAELDESFCLRIATWQIGMDMVAASPVIGHGLRSIQNAEVATDYLSDRHTCSHLEKYGVRAAHNILVEVSTDSGLVGLMLFVGVLLSAWFTSGRIVRRTRGVPAMFWAHDLAAMMQVSILAYSVGSMLLSFTYYSGIYVIVAAVAILWRLVREHEGSVDPRRVVSTGPRRGGRRTLNPAE